MSNQTNREPSAPLIAHSEVGIDDALKTQNLIKQHNKNENNSDGSIRKIMKLMQITMHDAIPPISRTEPVSCTIARKPEKVQEILRSAIWNIFLQQIPLNNKIRVRNDETRID